VTDEQFPTPPEENLPETPPAVPPPRIQPKRVAVRMPTARPLVCYALLGVTVLIYLLQMGSQYWLGYDLPAQLGAKINSLIAAGEWWRFITPVFLHGSLLHIGFNMYALYVIGGEVERFYGHWQFLALYLVSGFSGVVASFALTDAASLGASTAVFGLLAAQGVFAYQNQRIFGPRARHAYRNIIYIALINFMIGLSPGIDNWGHFGGLVGGLLVAWFGGPIFDLKTIGEEHRLENRRESSDFTRSALAAVLLFTILAAGMILIRGGL